jgi:hypothetical protein
LVAVVLRRVAQGQELADEVGLLQAPRVVVVQAAARPTRDRAERPTITALQLVPQKAVSGRAALTEALAAWS